MISYLSEFILYFVNPQITTALPIGKNFPTKPNLEYKRGQCKLSNQKYIEGKYKSTDCSIDFITSPYPKINGHGYGGSNNSELEGAKCIDNLYKELKVKYPNISP